ncbi:MAG TPA: oligosaccharide flippase family protein [Stellaceae bacterium]|nr:oligosaccharide flippase family protein [Stellaceae bacterium]
MLSTAILSRLLTPREFGVYYTILALTSVTGAWSQEFGGANYLIQKPSLSEQDIRVAFTTMFCLSALLAVILFALRGVAASFFSEEGLRAGIGVSALGFLLAPFSATLSALLRRELVFDVIARCNLSANVITAGTAIALSAEGWGFMGPVLGAFAGHCALVALLLIYRRDLRIFRPAFRGCRDVIDFGAYSSANVIINCLYESSPQLILGRIIDFTAVGLYGRAVAMAGLFDKLFLGVLHPVILPAISAQTRVGADLRRIYLEAIELVTAAQWPFLTFTALMAYPIVWVWLGPGWTEIVPLVRMLCLASLSFFAAFLTYPVLVAIGRIRDTFVLSLISVPPSLLVIFAASFFGLHAVAASAFLILPFQAAVAISFVSRRLAIAPIDLLRATRKSAAVTAGSCSGVMLSLAINHFTFAIPVISLLGACVIGLTGWYLGLVITGHPLLAQIRLVITGTLGNRFSVLRPFTWKRKYSPLTRLLSADRD